jgi:hypothetical protein
MLNNTLCTRAFATVPVHCSTPCGSGIVVLQVRLRHRPGRIERGGHRLRMAPRRVHPPAVRGAALPRVDGTPSRAHGVLTGYPAGSSRRRAPLCGARQTHKSVRFNIGYNVASDGSTSDAPYRCTQFPRRDTAASRRRSSFCEARSTRSRGNG